MVSEIMGQEDTLNTHEGSGPVLLRACLQQVQGARGVEGMGLQPGTGSAPCALPLSSLPMAGGTQPQDFILGIEKVLSMLLRAARDPSHDYRSLPSQLLSLPQFPQWLMLWDKGNSSQFVPLISLHFCTSIKLLCKCHPDPRLQEQLRCMEVKRVGAGQDGGLSS